MAKDVFYRSKPHISAASVNRLRDVGFSFSGAWQIANGHVVTNPSDRALIAEVLRRVADAAANGADGGVWGPHWETTAGASG